MCNTGNNRPSPGFEVTPRESTTTTFVQLRHEDLVTNAKSFKSEDSYLEVRLNNFLLEAGLQIVSTPIIPDNMDVFMQTLKYLKNELHPFVIYALDGQGPLSKQVCSVGVSSIHLCTYCV